MGGLAGALRGLPVSAGGVALPAGAQHGAIGRAGSQSISNGVWTVLDMTVAVHDPDGLLDIVTDQGEFTVDRDGLWFLLGSWSWTNNTSNWRYYRVEVNGSPAPGETDWGETADGLIHHDVQKGLWLSDGDVVRVKVTQNATGSLNTTVAHLALLYLGES